MNGMNFLYINQTDKLMSHWYKVSGALDNALNPITIKLSAQTVFFLLNVHMYVQKNVHTTDILIHTCCQPFQFLLQNLQHFSASALTQKHPNLSALRRQNTTEAAEPNFEHFQCMTY